MMQLSLLTTIENNIYTRSLDMMKRNESIKKMMICCSSILLLGTNVYAAAIMDATFGSSGESGIKFDNSYDIYSPDAQTAYPGINFAGAGGVNASLAQVYEFDSAISTSATGGAGIFVSEDVFDLYVGLTVTPTYTDTSPAQTGLPYVMQHYTVFNQTASTINDIWMMSYLNADLFRSNSEDPAQRVGLLNDEQVTVSVLDAGPSDVLSFHQFQADLTEIFFQGMMYKDGILTAPEKYMVEGPGTESGGGDAVYDEIFDYGTTNFSDAADLYSTGTPLAFATPAEYAFAIAFNLGSLAPGEYAEIAIAMSTEEGTYSADYFYNQYPMIIIPEPATLILTVFSIFGLVLRKKRSN